MKINCIINGSNFPNRPSQDFPVVNGCIRGAKKDRVGTHPHSIVVFSASGGVAPNFSALDGDGVFYRTHPGDFLAVYDCQTVPGSLILYSFQVQSIQHGQAHCVPAQL